MNHKTILIADLHLSEHSGQLNQLFAASLQTWQSQAIDALYILGDFFDAWIGDDDDTPFTQTIKRQLRDFTAHIPVYYIHGNRDFLLGHRFAAQTGIQILPEVQQIQLYGKNYLITHGDQLCTDDLPYMQFRQQSRNPMWQQAVLAKPLAERRLLAAQIRQISENGKTVDGKSAISDVTENAIATLMQAHPDVDVLIHGHTHRPAVHQHQLAQGRTITRHVLQDWYDKTAGCIIIDASGVRSETWTDTH